MSTAPPSPRPHGTNLGPTPSSSSSTSVFNALGSYADRIRDKDSQSATGSSSSKTSPNPPMSSLPNGPSTTQTAATSTAASSSGSPSIRPVKSAMPPPPTANPSSKAGQSKEAGKQKDEGDKAQGLTPEDDGAWETVPAGKSRRKEKDSSASTNWRDRPKEKKEGGGSGWRSAAGAGAGGEEQLPARSSGGGDKKKAPTSGPGETVGAKTGSALGASASSQAGTSTRSTSHPSATPASAVRSSSITPASSRSNPWGIVTPSPSTSAPAPTPAASASSSTSGPKPKPQATSTTTPPSGLNPYVAPAATPQTGRTASTSVNTPSSPSIAGTTAVNTSVTGSLASPDLSSASAAETASTSTAATTRGGTEEDEDWRVRPRKLSAEMVDKQNQGDAADVIQEKQEAKDKEVAKVVEVPQAAPPPATNAWAERRKAMGMPSTVKAAQAPANPSFPAVSSSANKSTNTTTTVSPSTTSTAAPTSTSPITTIKPNGPEKPAALLFGSVEITESKPLHNGTDDGVKIASSSSASALTKKKKPQRHTVDIAAFPDLAQAVQATQADQAKKHELEQERLRGRREKEEEGSVVDDAAATGSRKPKWTPIPAAELLAAADAAESQRRQARDQSLRRKPAGPGPGPSTHHSIPASGETSPQKAARKKSVESKRGRTTRAGSGSGEIRLPPNPFPRRGSAASGSGFKPVFGSFRPNGTGNINGDISPEHDSTTGRGGASEPMSRQTSASVATSPQRSRTQANSPIKVRDAALPSSNSVSGDSSGLRIGAGAYIPSGAGMSALMTGSNTAPLPQAGFPPMGMGMRGARGGRQSFSTGRGRGAYRGVGAFKGSPGGGMGMGMLDQGMGLGYMPNGYGPSGNGNGNGNGSGSNSNSGRSGPAGGNGNGFEGGMHPPWDPMQGYGMPMFGSQGQGGQGGGNGAAGRSGHVQGLPMPPPPMPVTQAVGLDALRFYVLGQVEYYFSMQNLAMDFFLRQQMDSEGWIDIGMISSFNRIKSLTPDTAIIKEMMHLSALLEVREDKVRLSHGESKRWVLPDAKQSPYTDDHSGFGAAPGPGGSGSGSGGPGTNGDSGEGGLGLEVGWGSIPIANGTHPSGLGLGFEEKLLGLGTREGLAQDVEMALMKSSSSARSVSAATAEAETETAAGEGDNEAEIAVSGDEGAKGVNKEQGVSERNGAGTSTPGPSLAGEQVDKVELR